MENIIVTIFEEEGKAGVDMEVPLNAIAGRLTADVIEILRLVRPDVLKEQCTYQLVHQRSGKLFSGAVTIGEFGVWNGDILVLMRT